MDVVSEIKAQYARKLRQSDWKHFKDVAEYYLKTAARLKNKDIKSQTNKLLLRNSQKRLFLGIGCELLLKAFYLKNGYCINKLQPSYQGMKVPTHKLSTLLDQDINPNDTFTMQMLIDNLHNVGQFQNLKVMKRGFQIAMTFRNKEGHVTFPIHDFDHANYRDIAEAVEAFYAEAFRRNLVFRISMKPNEPHVFRFEHITNSSSRRSRIPAA